MPIFRPKQTVGRFLEHPQMGTRFPKTQSEQVSYFPIGLLCSTSPTDAPILQSEPTCTAYRESPATIAIATTPAAIQPSVFIDALSAFPKKAKDAKCSQFWANKA